MKKIILILFSLTLFTLAISIINKQKTLQHKEFGGVIHPSTFGISAAQAYPPAVGILSNSKNCMSCHANNGPWKDESKTVIDILDKETKKSFKQTDGSFLIEVNKGEQRSILTVIGYKKENADPAPNRNAWLYIDSLTIGTNSLSKFPPGWDVNLPMSCRLVGDKLQGFEDAVITSLPMTIQPTLNAKDAEMQLQVMITAGESVKGNAKEGMTGNYFQRKVKLKIK